MARTIPHRELRNNSALILRDVQAGETFEVTNHGEVVALLIPPSAERLPLRMRRATKRGQYSQLQRVRLDEPIASALDDLRGER